MPSGPPEESDESRHNERHKVGIDGRYRCGRGVSRDVWITDISETGCRFYDRFGNMAPGTDITIRIGPVGPIDAQVRWLEQHVNGVEFLQPLHVSVFEHIVANLSEPVDPDDPD